MRVPDIPYNEEERLKDLYSYGLPDFTEQPEFNNLVKLASTICEVPISLITLLDEEKQWFKVKVGLDADCTSRDVSFCGHAINTPDKIFVIEDATKDDRFKDNPLVTGEPRIVFYAGVPLVTNDGNALGTICVIDRKPRTLNKQQLDLLKGLSKQVIRLFELRKTIKELEDKESEQEQMIGSMAKYVNSIGYDLKMSFRNIEIATEILSKFSKDDSSILEQVTNINRESSAGIHLINEVLKIAESEKRGFERKKA